MLGLLHYDSVSPKSLWAFRFLDEHAVKHGTLKHTTAIANVVATSPPYHTSVIILHPMPHQSPTKAARTQAKKWDATEKDKFKDWFRQKYSSSSGTGMQHIKKK